VEKTDMNVEEKMLRLRGALTGRAKTLIQDLQSFSSNQYIEALRRLEREYGTDKREGQRLLENLSQFQKIPDEDKGKTQKLEALLNCLNTAISFMEAAGRQSELGDGMTYTVLKSKIPETELLQYHMWQRQNGKKESVESMRDWLDGLVEMMTMVKEAVSGIENTHRSPKIFDKKTNYTFDKENKPWQKTSRTFASPGVVDCLVCNQNHRVADCRKFKEMSMGGRWHTVKNRGLCRLCLDQGRLAAECDKKGNSQVTHYPLLSKENNRSTASTGKGGDKPKSGNWSRNDRKPTPTSTQQTPEKDAKNKKQDRDQVHVNVTGHISLRTVPVILGYNNKTALTYAMLDDGSSESYLLEDLAHELKLPIIDRAKRLSMVFGDKTEEYHSMKVEGLTIKGIDQEDRFEIPRIWTPPTLVGDAPIVDWNQKAENWGHLAGVPFPTRPERRLGS
jgi:hypothetical protein